MDPLQVIIWICVAVFALTALLSLLNLTGIYKLPDPKHGEMLFKVLIVEIAVIAVAAFGNVMKNSTKISESKPITGQVFSGEKAIATGDSGVTFTPGIIADEKTVAAINKLAPETPTTYSGSNFINREAGFLLTVEHPELWQVTYNPAGMTNSAIAVNTFTSQDGAYLTVGIENVAPGTTIEQYVSDKNQYMPVKPQVWYDLPSNTAFLVLTNPSNMGESYMKLVLNTRNSRLYYAIANYNRNFSPPATLAMLSSMVGSFTVIAE